MKFWLRRAMRERRRHRPAHENASKSSLEALRATRTDKDVQRLIAAEKSRIRPSDKELDTLAEISDEDITHAVDEWNKAQAEHKTGLDGLLDARVADDG